ncbi:hypothetical protein B566_EDAN001926 [Ephemera danica]|nr:hypothetical protein B566_EDAN001926 [Ephemera danica]
MPRQDDSEYLISADGVRRTSISSNDGVEDTTQCFKTRHTLALMGFLGFANVYAMRVNLSVAIVAMVNNSAIPQVNQSYDVCPGPVVTNTTVPPADGEFAWDEGTQGMILGAFFYGYVLTQVPGGRYAELCGGKLVFGLGVLVTALFTLASPIAARTGKGVFVAVRVLEGLGEGVTFPAMHVMLSRWIPPLERSKYAAYVYAGSHFGTVLSMPLSGYLCSIEGIPGGGWPLAFYLTGGLGIAWFVAWMFLVSDSPDTHPSISQEERSYINHSLGNCTHSKEKRATRVPWCAMLTSPPVLAILVTQCGQTWAFYTILMELPTYMSNILHFNIKQNSLLSTLPYMTNWIFGILFSQVSDLLVSRSYLSRKTSYKLFNSICSVLPAACLVGIALVGCNREFTLALLAVNGVFSGAGYGGYQMNHISLSPTFAGTMYGVTNAAGNMCGFLAPYVTGLLINGQETLSRWRLVFFISAGVAFSTNIVYVMFASDKEQEWSKGPPPDPICINSDAAETCDTGEDHHDSIIADQIR